jgi:adenylyl- and sulfurtransferase ThiI
MSQVIIDLAELGGKSGDADKMIQELMRNVNELTGREQII